MNNKECKNDLLYVLNKNGYEISILSLDINLVDNLGMDSLKKTQIICDIEDFYGEEIPLEMLEPKRFRTIGDLLFVANYLKERTNGTLGFFK